MTVRFFQIGFNKCGTTSLYKLFSRSGVPCVKFSGTKESLVSGREPYFWNVQVRMRKNIRKGKNPLAGLSDSLAFFDMEHTTDDDEIENFKNFKDLYKVYPNSKYLLNTRDKWDWIKSRAGHIDGDYLRRAANRNNRAGFQMLDHWLDDFDTHHANVREFFADKQDQFLEFNIDTDPIKKLIDFAAPEFELDKQFWQHLNFRRDTRADVADKIFSALFQADKPPSSGKTRQPKEAAEDPADQFLA